MASDQVILLKDVLDAVIKVRRTGIDSLLRELERQEPDFAEIIFEEISTISQKLNEISESAKGARRIMRRTESLILTAVLAIRQGYRRLWTEQTPDALDSPPESALKNGLAARDRAPVPRNLTPARSHSVGATPVGLYIEPPLPSSGDHPSFCVVYSINIDAPDARMAAVSVHHIMSGLCLMGPVMHVIDHAGKITVVDLAKDDTTESKNE